MLEVLERRRREATASAPVNGFVYFRTPEDAAVVTQQVVSLFGVVLDGCAVKTAPAAEWRRLHVSNLPRTLTPAAMAECLSVLLAGAGLRLSLADQAAMRQGMTSNGEVVIEFESHADAVAAAHELRGSKVSPSPLSENGGTVVVGWASRDDWRQAKPRAPIVL